ncbi:hypothetical protein K501DRAFT_312278 [Backusella circina FSU 941]|nr:hypothetical protein K501DRAFT_312278 [Backusella circina FSU 941]
MTTLTIGKLTIQNNTVNGTNELHREPLKINIIEKNIKTESSVPIKFNRPNPGVRHLLDQIPKVLSRAEIPNIDAGADDDYPTDTELLLFAYCLTNRDEPSCAVFFRFAHYLFAGRINTDPVLAAALEEKEEELELLTATKYYSVNNALKHQHNFSNIIYNTIEITEDVITEIDVTITYYETDPEKYYSDHPTNDAPSDELSGELGPNEDPDGINSLPTPTNLITCPDQCIKETITATNIITYTADSTKTINGPVSTVTVGVYSTVTEGPVSTVYTGKVSTLYTGSVSTVTATPTTIGAPVSTLTETSTSTLTVGVYTTVTDKPGYTTTATPTVIGAPVTTITKDPVTVTVGVYTTVTEGPVSTIYTGEISTITTGAVTTITALPPTTIAGPATTITVTSIPESINPDNVCATVTKQSTRVVYTGNVTTVYTGKVTTVTVPPSITNSIPIATFTQYVPLVNFNMIPSNEFMDNMYDNFMANPSNASQSPRFTENPGSSLNSSVRDGLGRSLLNGHVHGNSTNEVPLTRAGDSPQDKLKDFFGSDFVNAYGDLLANMPVGSIGQLPSGDYGGGVYQNGGHIIDDEDDTNNDVNISVNSNNSSDETVPNNNGEVVVQNIYNNFYGGFGNGEFPGQYVNYKGEMAWSSPYGLYFDNGTRITFYTNCSFTGNIPSSLLNDQSNFSKGSKSSTMLSPIEDLNLLESASNGISSYQPLESESVYTLTQYYPTFCTDNAWEEEILGDPVDCIINTIIHPQYCSEYGEHDHEDDC